MYANLEELEQRGIDRQVPRVIGKKSIVDFGSREWQETQSRPSSRRWGSRNKNRRGELKRNFGRTENWRGGDFELMVGGVPETASDEETLVSTVKDIGGILIIWMQAKCLNRYRL